MSEVVVCPEVEIVTKRRCAYERCNKEFQAKSNRHRFCGSRCRVYEFRRPELERRNRWNEAKYRDSFFTLGGLTVRRPAWLGPLSEFEKYKKENQNEQQN